MGLNAISRRCALISAAALLFSGISLADDWPTKRPITAVVPFAAGSSTDVIARAVMDEVSKQIGQAVVIENRAGASGTIGSNAVAKASPDGYTLLIHSSSHTVTPSTFRSLPYNPEADLAPVIPLANIPNVVVVNATKGYRTLRELVEDAKRRPGALNYASAGAGTATHLTAERLRQSAAFEAQHVAFRGSSEALTEVLAGRMDFYCAPVNTAIELIKDGRITALAVSSSQRASALPEVPTTAEAGFPNSEYEFWIGAFLPRQSPSAIADRLHAEIARAVSSPALTKRLADLGANPMNISQVEFEALIRREVQANALLVAAAGIKPN